MHIRDQLSSPILLATNKDIHALPHLTLQNSYNHLTSRVCVIHCRRPPSLVTLFRSRSGILPFDQHAINYIPIVSGSYSMQDDVDMDAPQISTLREEETPEPQPSLNRTSKFRVKLLVGEGKRVPSSSGTPRKIPQGDSEEDEEDDDDEEDQLIDDDEEEPKAPAPTPAISAPPVVEKKGTVSKRGGATTGRGRGRGRGGRGAKAARMGTYMIHPAAAIESHALSRHCSANSADTQSREYRYQCSWRFIALCSSRLPQEERRCGSQSRCYTGWPQKTSSKVGCNQLSNYHHLTSFMSPYRQPTAVPAHLRDDAGSLSEGKCSIHLW